MDKKNTTIGVLLLLAAFATMYFSSRMSPPSPAPAARELTQSPGPNLAQSSLKEPTSPLDAAFTAAPKTVAVEPVLVSLSNDFLRVDFTNYGGAIKQIALIGRAGKGEVGSSKGTGYKYALSSADSAQPYLINRNLPDPVLAFVGLPGLDRNTPYEVLSKTETEIVFRTVYQGKVEVLRRYALVKGAGGAEGDPYQLVYETSFRNPGDQAAILPRALLNVGTSTPISADDVGLYLSHAYRTNNDTTFIKRSETDGGGFLSWFGLASRDPKPQIEVQAPLDWVSTQNQFFVSLLTPDQAASGLFSRRVDLPAFPGVPYSSIGLKGEVRFDLPALPAGGETKLSGRFYAGPKEYKRLSNPDIFKLDQDAVMDLGFFAFFSKILLTLMTWVHKVVPNWGLAIILTTLILKFVFLPLNLSASKAAKRMAKIQPEMTALREKFKDNPQKLQTETMELFKRHKVNPMGGCFPILITIPFFIGFFSMLQSAAELRFERFLWASDLSAPDTVALLFGVPINIMPVLMGATMIIQMRLTPQPTVDNAQAKMMKFMPYIFALFCYNFSCALSLYSTVNGAFSIVQQLVVNRMKDEETAPVAPTPSGKGGRPVKNITPGKKK